MNDAELAAAVLGRDPASEELFYSRLQPRLYKAAVYFLGFQDPEAEDVVQQALLIAFQKLPGYDPSRASLYTWTARICANLCYQRLDKRRREAVSSLEDMEGALEKLGAEREARDEEGKRQEGLKVLLRAAMGRLAEACRRILTLRDLEGLSYAEVGRAIKAPLGTVMSKLSRCRRALKAAVESRTADA